MRRSFRMREDYLDAIAELEEALSPFHLESDGEWTNYEFNTSTIRVSIEALEKQVEKKGKVFFGGWLDCPNCENDISGFEERPNYCPNCGQKIDWSDK